MLEGEKIIKPDRRRPERPRDRLAALGGVVAQNSWEERRVHCWDLDPDCTEERRKQCAAYFVRRNCWDLWAAEYFPPGRKPCCHGELDCVRCPVTTAKFGGTISVHVAVPRRESGRRGGRLADRPAAYCPHLYSIKEDSDREEGKLVFRCQLRTGVRLHSSYVSEVCGTSEYGECAFQVAE